MRPLDIYVYLSMKWPEDWSFATVNDTRLNGVLGDIMLDPARPFLAQTTE